MTAPTSSSGASVGTMCPRVASMRSSCGHVSKALARGRDLRRRFAVVGSPEHRHREFELTEFCFVALVDHRDQHRAHHAVCVSVVRRPETLTRRFHSSVAHQPERVKTSGDEKGAGHGGDAGQLDEGNARENQRADELGAGRRENGRHPAAERVAHEHHGARRDLLQDGRDQFAVHSRPAGDRWQR